jgi:hypothetical protein
LVNTSAVLCGQNAGSFSTPPYKHPSRKSLPGFLPKSLRVGPILLKRSV